MVQASLKTPSVAKNALELLTSSRCLWSAGITEIYHHIWFQGVFLKISKFAVFQSRKIGCQFLYLQIDVCFLFNKISMFIPVNFY